MCDLQIENLRVYLKDKQVIAQYKEECLPLWLVNHLLNTLRGLNLTQTTRLWQMYNLVF